MELLIRNAEGNVPESEKDYAVKKLSKLERYFHRPTKVEMVHSEQKGKHRLELTVFADGLTVRGEELDESLMACIDKVSDKLDSRLRRLKKRIVDSHRKGGVREIPQALLEVHEEEDDHAKVVERKQFLVKDMSTDEAALQMELVDHPFFVYKDASSGEFTVLYKRKDGNYGLLQPEL